MPFACERLYMTVKAPVLGSEGIECFLELCLFPVGACGGEQPTVSDNSIGEEYCRDQEQEISLRTPRVGCASRQRR